MLGERLLFLLRLGYLVVSIDDNSKPLALRRYY
jgi:hypothetical protein